MLPLPLVLLASLQSPSIDPSAFLATLEFESLGVYLAPEQNFPHRFDFNTTQDANGDGVIDHEDALENEIRWQIGAGLSGTGTSGIANRGPNDQRPAVYFHHEVIDNYEVYEYWLYYSDNFYLNVHEHDWEKYFVYVQDGQPKYLRLSSHSDFNLFRFCDEFVLDDGHPVIRVTSGAHAINPGTADGVQIRYNGQITANNGRLDAGDGQSIPWVIYSNDVGVTGATPFSPDPTSFFHGDPYYPCLPFGLSDCIEYGSPNNPPWLRSDWSTPATAPIVYLGPDRTICPGYSTVLDAGSGFDAYLWSTGATTQTIIAAQPGLYSVTVFDGNCTTADTILVQDAFSTTLIQVPIQVLYDFVGNAGTGNLSPTTSGPAQASDISISGALTPINDGDNLTTTGWPGNGFDGAIACTLSLTADPGMVFSIDGSAGNAVSFGFHVNEGGLFSLDKGPRDVRVELSIDGGVSWIVVGDDLDNPRLADQSYLAALPPVAPCDGVQSLSLRILASDGMFTDSPEAWLRISNLLIDCAVVDACELTDWADCNGNGTNDACDLASGASLDLDADGVPDECQPLSGDLASISVSSGGSQLLSLDGGIFEAGQSYLLMGSTSGDAPGIPYGPWLVPLNPGPYFLRTLVSPNTPPLAGSFGSLDGSGLASAGFSIPAGSDPALAGLRVHHAFVVVDLAPLPPVIRLVSNAIPVDLIP